ncbi:hypothetical protein N0V90_005026 [Kalmusia sp. IMI 367209]|nr:hypothetical protein N0V90_005026 [Kalmusia sp. IMI 367209]
MWKTGFKSHRESLKIRTREQAKMSNAINGPWSWERLREMGLLDDNVDHPVNNPGNVERREGDPLQLGHPDIVMLGGPGEGPRLGNQFNAQRQQQWERI